MKFSSKISLLLFAAIIVSAAFPCAALYLFFKFEERFSQYIAKNVNEFVIASDLNAQLVRYDAALWKYVASDNKYWLEEAKRVKKALQQNLNLLTDSYRNDKEAVQTLTQVKQLQEEYFEQAEHVVPPRTKPKDEQEQIKKLTKQYNERLVPMYQKVNTLVEKKEVELSKASNEVRNELRKFLQVSMVMGAVFVPLLTLLAWFIYRTTSRPINQVTDMVSYARVDDMKSIDRMNDGLRAFVAKRNPNDEIAMLARKLSEFGLAMKEMTNELSTLIMTDEKTKLFNYRYFKSQMRSEIARAKRFREPLSLIMLDVDKFKVYNDTNGHLLGDEVLKKVARLMKEECRETDIPARFGGEEFSVLLPRTDKSEAVMIAERIRKSIEDAVFVNQEAQPGGNLTASLGVATFPNDASDEESLVSSADIALYDAKHKGRNRVVHFEDVSQATATSG
jgi:diguanylate cyclase (GGDEF)-like protein